MGNLRVLGRPARRVGAAGRHRAPNVDGMRDAIARFLGAAGLDLSDRHLRETPDRVASTWAEEYLGGYREDPKQILRELYPAPAGSGGELVVLSDLRFHSMCPHHLLPYQGRAHLAYMPGRFVVGFGKLTALLECFAHRLILQEDLARLVAREMAEGLKSPATACLVEAEQSCMRARGECQRDSRVFSEAYEGRLRTDRQLRRSLWLRLGSAR